jgi:hypothetical protein
MRTVDFSSSISFGAATEALGNQKRGSHYRVTDEEMYRVIDPKEAIVFAYPKGTVLFIDSSRCFHYGSRDRTSRGCR